MTRDAINVAVWVDRPRRTTCDEVLDILDNWRPSWHAHAACSGRTDIMFGHRSPGRRPDDQRDHAHALALCAACSVRTQCAEQGAREHHGVWAGQVKDPVKPHRKSRAGAPRTDRQVNPTPTLEFLRANGGWWSCRDLGERIGVTERTARRHVVALLADGLLDTRITPERRPAVYRARKGRA